MSEIGLQNKRKHKNHLKVAKSISRLNYVKTDSGQNLSFYFYFFSFKILFCRIKIRKYPHLI